MTAHETTEPYSAETISLIGTGPMGRPMAEHLIRRYGPVRVWNRTVERAAPLQALGARVVSNPAEAASELVVTVLPDLPEVVDVVYRDDGLRAGWRARGVEHPVLVIHGTVSPDPLRAFAARAAADCGATVVDAPVSGGTIGAERGDLAVMVGGPGHVVEQLSAVLSSYARTVLHFGDTGAGATAKLCNQIVVAGTVTVISEAFLLAARSGLDPARLLEALRHGLGDSEVLRQKGSRWLQADHAGGGSAANQLKDLRFVLDVAASTGTPVPVSEVVAQLFREVTEFGDGPLDHTVVVRALARRAE